MDTPCGVFFYLVNLVCKNYANSMDKKFELSQHRGSAHSEIETGNV